MEAELPEETQTPHQDEAIRLSSFYCQVLILCPQSLKHPSLGHCEMLQLLVLALGAGILV